MPHMLKRYLYLISSFLRRAVRRSKAFYCPVCQSSLDAFQPIPHFYETMRRKYFPQWEWNAFETLNAESYSCPHCGASDRDRLYALYFNRLIPSLNQNHPIQLLDIAPSKPLALVLSRLPWINRRTMDFYRTDVDDQCDICNMTCYQDNQFDAFICSHVLEHIPDDMAALKELLRTTKPGGWGILMVPINLEVQAIDEDPTITDTEDRQRRFAQEDHVRLYNKAGFKSRVEQAGFHLEEHTVTFFGEEAFAKCGITPKSVLYIATKPENTL